MNFARIRWSVLTIAAATCAVLVVAWLHAPAAEARSAVFTAPESHFVVAINAQRTAAGLQPLSIDDTMAASAAEWTSHMVARSFIGHADPRDIQSSTPGERSKAGENVGRGRSVRSLVAAFMQSPAHRSNIMDPAFTHIGVGVQVHPLSGRVYTTHRFASLPDTPEPAPAELVPSATTTADPPALESVAPTSAATPAQSAARVASQPRGARLVDGSDTIAETAHVDEATSSNVRGSRRGVD